jgi:D-aminopeptidase
MATEMSGANGHWVPALPLDEVRRFVAATRPIFQGARPPPTPDAPHGPDERGIHTAEAAPTRVRSAEGIPYPTRPADGRK